MNQFILMADIIHSGDKAPAALMDQFKSVVHSVNAAFHARILSPFTITLGDEFQGIVKDLPTGIECMIMFEEKLLQEKSPFKLRYVLHEGAVETPINPERAHEMLGEGLTFARKSLDQLKRSFKRFNVISNHHKRSQMLNRLFALLQHFLDSWHEKDLATIHDFIQGKDYKEIAKKQGKDASSLWRKEKSLAINEYIICKSLIQEVASE